jgi:hypothetical protein
MAFAWKEEGIYVQNYQKYIEKVLTYTQRKNGRMPLLLRCLKMHAKIFFGTKSKETPGLPDFSWYNIPKTEKIPRNVPNGHKIFQNGCKIL